MGFLSFSYCVIFVNTNWHMPYHLQTKSPSYRAFWIGKAMHKLLNIPGGIRTPDRSLRRRMLYPAELLRHDVFASRIPIYFTAWGGLCQGLVGLGGPLFLAGRLASSVLSRDLASASYWSALLLNLSPGLPSSDSSSPKPQPTQKETRTAVLVS